MILGNTVVNEEIISFDEPSWSASDVARGAKASAYEFDFKGCAEYKKSRITPQFEWLWHGMSLNLREGLRTHHAPD